MSNIQKDFQIKQGLRDPGYWLGGVVEKLVSPKRSAQAKAHPSVSTPEPTPAPAAPATEPSPAATLRESITATRRREAEAGLAAGGPVHGAGGPTEDKVRIRVSPGEYVVNAAAVDAVGEDTLDAINEVGRDKMRARGTLRGQVQGAYATGGPVDDPRRRVPGQGLTPMQTPMAPQPIRDPAVATAVSNAQTQPIVQGAQDFASGVMPGTRSVLRSAGEDFATNVGQGQYGRAAAQAVKGAVALPAAIVDDLAQPFVKTFGTPTVPDTTELASQARGFSDELGFTSAAPAAPTLRSTMGPSVQGGRGVVNPPVVDPSAPPPVAPSGLVRDGNSFSGTGPTPAFSGFGIGVDGYQRQRENIANTMADVNAQRPTAVIGRDLAAERNAQFDIDVARGRADSALRLNPGRAGAAAAAAYNGQADQMIRERQQTAAERGATLRAQVQDATARRGQDVSVANNERTVGATLRGQDLTARSAAATARLDQMNKDRTYQLDVAKFGTETANKNASAREAAAKALTERVQTLFPGADGKPDAQKTAAFMGTTQQSLGALITRLKASGDEKLLAKGRMLEERGMAGLDESDLATLKTLFDRKAVVDAEGSGPVSENLFDYAISGFEKNRLTPNAFTLGEPGSGRKVSVRQLRYDDPNVLNPFQRERSNLLPTETERRRLRSTIGEF